MGSNQLSQLSETEEGRLRELASEAPTVNLLNRLISRVFLKMRASDIHIEPSERSVLVRYRIDGVLQDAETVPLRLQLPLVSRVKILAGMDIAERRRPQDGKIELRISNTDLDIRVSALPLQEGESVVMRLLRKDAISYSFDSLDLLPDTKAAISADLARTTGVILMTGTYGVRQNNLALHLSESLKSAGRENYYARGSCGISITRFKSGTSQT